MSRLSGWNVSEEAAGLVVILALAVEEVGRLRGLVFLLMPCQQPSMLLLREERREELLAMVQQETIHKSICHLVMLKRIKFFYEPGAEAVAYRVQARQAEEQEVGAEAQSILAHKVQAELAETVAHLITLL
jgi:hypothetical protein